MARRDNAPKKHSTKRQLTSNQQEWKHQVTNLKRRIRDLEGLGVYVNYEIPSMPSRVTKSAIEKIKNIKREQLVKFAFGVAVTGEIIENVVLPQRGRVKEWRQIVKRLKKEEQRRYEPDYESDEILEELPVSISTVEIDRLKQEIASYGDSALTRQLYSLLDKAIYERGLDNVASMVEENYSQLSDSAQRAVKYKGDTRGAGNVALFAEIVLGRVPTFTELADLNTVNEADENFELPI